MSSTDGVGETVGDVMDGLRLEASHSDSLQDTSVVLDDRARVGEEFPDLDDDEERESTSTLSLFEGDEGGLLFTQRRALVHLVKEPFVSAQTHPREWRALISNPRPIRSRLNDLFMTLELDSEREVAFTRQAAPEGGGRSFPTMFYDQAWPREETVVLLCLRVRFHTEQAAGNGRAFINRDDIHDYVARFRPAHATDKAADHTRVERAIDKVYKTGLLIGRKTADRFEIARAIEVVMPLPKLNDLLSWLRQENGTDELDPPAHDPSGRQAGSADSIRTMHDAGDN